ncbi:MAG: peptidoglycan bridge formation glycyltransferase FemA/FemB family protein [Chloroflexi bacterium]|nr:peptidoglycan bridge formation glycyltransferase FemA/FemB family protein [Chloroflexota bacterium]
MTAPVSWAEWDAFLEQHPEAHLLQTSAWARLKTAFGWEATPFRTGESGALVLWRRLPLGFRLGYIPRGPVGPWSDALWAAVDAYARRRRAVFLKLEPDLWEEEARARWPQGHPPGFQPSPQSIQPPRTIIIDLRPSEAEILARMKQKTRYNIRLAARKGVTVRPWEDVDAFYRMLQETAQRDGFGIHPAAYYRRAYELFHPRGEAELLVAEWQGQPLAALMVFARGPRAWYFYGASTSQHRNKMPTYLLQWEAMRWAKARGCQWYDLWGIPDEDESTLEAEFLKRRGGLWGVYRFKRGFGGVVKRTAGPWDRVYLAPLYALYRTWAQRRAAR